MRALTKEDQANISPSAALTLLKNGNDRFVKNLQADRNLLEQVRDTSTGQ